MSNSKELLDIEKRLESMCQTLKRQEAELESWRHRSTRLPNWIRNSGVAIFMAIFVQTMTSVWWASEITNTQKNLENNISMNTDYRIASTEKYQNIMIELSKLSSSVSIMTKQNQTLLDAIHSNVGVILKK
jgi:hypothetical protein